MMSTTKTGVRAPPKREPACVAPCAKPRSVGNIQRESDRVAIGKAPASPIPKRKRINAIDPALQASTVAQVNRDHHVTMSVSARRGPIRSPSQPPGIWKIAYAHWNELRIHPMVTMEKPNSFWMDGTAEEMTTRSI